MGRSQNGFLGLAVVTCHFVMGVYFEDIVPKVSH